MTSDRAFMMGYDALVDALSPGWDRVAILNHEEAAAEGIPALDERNLYVVFLRRPAWVSLPVRQGFLDDEDSDLVVSSLRRVAEGAWAAQMEKRNDK